MANQSTLQTEAPAKTEAVDAVAELATEFG